MKKAPHQKLSTSASRLRYLRALIGMSRAHLQEKHGIPEVTLKSWESGTVKLTTAAIKRCVDVYRTEGLIVSEDWILDGTGLDPTQALNVSKYFAKPSKDAVSYEDDETCMMRDADLFKKSYSNAVVLIVSNDEMRPFYKPGDYVGGKLLAKKEIAKAVNKDCIVYLKDGSHYFRRLIKNIQGGYNLTCLNPNEVTAEPVLYNVEIDRLAPVIWHRWKDD
jgi:hypothetical protein